MKATKRFLSAIMAMTMVCGTVVSVSAADDEENVRPNDSGGGYTGTMSGTGTSEGSIDMEKFRIVLPTTDISYTVDAQGLIKKSGGKSLDKNTTVVYSTREAIANGKKEITDAKVAPSTDATKPNYVKEDGFVFFTTTTGNKTKKASYFDITIENKSSFDVDIKPVLSYDTSASGNSLTAVWYTSTPGTKDLAFNLFQKEAELAANGKPTGKYNYKQLSETSVIKVEDAEAAYATEYKPATGDTAATYDYAFNATKYSAAVKAKTIKNNISYFTLEGVASNNIDATKDPGTVNIVWTFTKSVPAASGTENGGSGTENGDSSNNDDNSEGNGD